MEGFREMVEECLLTDLGYEGRRWTYEKCVAGGSFCRVRLDRALATPDSNSRYPIVGVLHHQTYQGVPEVVDCAVEDHDREIWNSKVCTRT
jgi:hypothetical protein